MKEKDLERKLVKAVRDSGSLALKFISPNLNGVPDRLLLFMGDKMAFAEVKAPGEKPRPLQVHRMEQLRTLGFRVYVVDSKEAIQRVILSEAKDLPRPAFLVAPPAALSLAPQRRHGVLAGGLAGGNEPAHEGQQHAQAHQHRPRSGGQEGAEAVLVRQGADDVVDGVDFNLVPRNCFQAGYEQAEKDFLSLIESRISEIIGDAQPRPALRAELQELIAKIRNQ